MSYMYFLFQWKRLVPLIIRATSFVLWSAVPPCASVQTPSTGSPVTTRHVKVSIRPYPIQSKYFGKYHGKKAWICKIVCRRLLSGWVTVYPTAKFRFSFIIISLLAFIRKYFQDGITFSMCTDLKSLIVQILCSSINHYVCTRHSKRC